MARIRTDGFDCYGVTGMGNSQSAGPFNTLVALLQYGWTALNVYTFSNAYPSIVASLNGVSGYAVQLTCTTDGAISLDQTLSSNYSRLIGGVRFASDIVSSAAQPAGVFFRDGNTVQCYLGVNGTTGTISLYEGFQPNAGGSPTALTVIQTSSATVTANSSHYLEWDIAFGAAGAYTVKLDGTIILTGTGNTKKSANSYANGYSLGTQRNGGTSGGQAFTVDDHYLFDTTGTTNNAILGTNPRIETSLMTSSFQINFAIPAEILGKTYIGISSANPPGANQLFLRKYTPNVSGTLNSISCIPAATSGGAKFKGVVYSDNAGAAGTLLSSGTEVTGATNGAVLTCSLVTPQSLVAGTPYWLGFITDTSVSLNESLGDLAGFKANNTYASGAPSSAPGMTSGQPSWTLWGNLTGMTQGWGVLREVPASPTYNYVADSNAGDEDLYGPAAMVTPTTVAQIYTSKVRALVSITGGGNRSISLRMKASGVEGTGSAGAFALSSGSPVYQDSFFDTNPATGLPWTQTQLNAALAGFKIEA